MRIAVDIMGGDNAPDEILKGSFAALPKLPPEDTLVLFGKGDLIEEAMKLAESMTDESGSPIVTTS